MRAGNEDRLAGYTALPLRLNPYQPGYFALIPAVGVFRPAPGTYDLVFDTTSRRAAGRFTFRFWVNDTSPPVVRVLSRTVTRGKLLLLSRARPRLRRRPLDVAREVDGSYRRSSGTRRTTSSASGSRPSRRGTHKLVFSVSDYQESKNNENDTATLPNTRKLTTSFAVR